MNIRACVRVNPGLWARFLERREALNETAPDPEKWTSPAVSAWLDVRKVKGSREPDYAKRTDRPSEGQGIRRTVSR